MQKKSNLLRFFLFHPEIFITIILSVVLYLLTRIDYSVTSFKYSFCIASFWYFIFPKYLKNANKTDLNITGILILLLSGIFVASEIVPLALLHILNKISKFPYNVLDFIFPLVLGCLLALFSIYILISNKSINQNITKISNSSLRVFIILWLLINCTFAFREINLHAFFLSIKGLLSP